MNLTVKYFASIRETIGHGSERLDTACRTLGQLRDELIARSPAHGQALARGHAVRAALNQTMSDEDAELSEACEVAFFPPVTGG